MFCAFTAFCWLLNILLITLVRKKWIQTWMRVLLSSFIMLGIGFTITLTANLNGSLTRLSLPQMVILRLTYVLSINLIVFILLDLIFKRESQLRLNRENAELKFTNLEAEYKLLKDQVNPHFLFNALSISKALIKNNPEQAEQYIKRLSDFLRVTIHINRKSASLKEELELAANFIELQKLRFGAALLFTVNIDERKLSQHIPFFTLVSLIENAIKHNNFTPQQPLEITVVTQDDMLVVENNVQPKFVLGPSKTGLANINQRTKLLSGNDIEVISNEEQFAVKIKLIVP
ncbi:sensor histidine kinase [Arundinibacter roseus]|nr:histidine kinase [Arundinibacter roseus]